MRHPVRHLARAILILTLFTLTACGSGPTPVPLPPTVPPTAVPTAPPSPPRAPATVSPPTAAALPVDAPTTAEIAPLFGPAWGDRAVYRSGLTQAEQAALDDLTGAGEYRISLAIADSMTRVTGQQQVRYTNRENTPLTEIYLRLFPNALGGKMDVTDVTLNGEPVAPALEFERTALRVPMSEPLQPGDSAVVGLRYDITVPQTLDAGYGLLSYTEGVLALDTPYAAIPVYNEEGWNVEIPPENADTSFNDAAFYLVQVAAPPDLTLVTTGVELDRQRGVKSNLTTYALAPGRDFFVAASADYTHASRQVGETRVHSYARAGNEARRDAALDAAANALAVYSRRFGPYPYTEFDVAETPMLALGIEYPGAVGISMRVYDAKNPDLAPVLESTVAHEAAHQWFYNLVGSDQIDEPWLDEALAQYATWLYFVDQVGEDRAQPWRDSWESRWDRTDRAEKPVGLPAEEYSPREYGAIVYGRGPLFVDTLAQRMGRARFDAFLGQYARDFRWGIATAADFRQRAEAACGCELDALYAEWLGR